jgi:hypothetical protein
MVIDCYSVLGIGYWYWSLIVTISPEEKHIGRNGSGYFDFPLPPKFRFIARMPARERIKGVGQYNYHFSMTISITIIAK